MYPSSYAVLLFADGELHRRAQTIFTRFQAIYDLSLSCLIQKIVKSLQGDDEANSGSPAEEDVFEDGDVGPEWPLVDDAPGRGFEVAQGGTGDLGKAGHVEGVRLVPRHS